MTPTVIIIALAGLLVAAVIVLIVIGRDRGLLRRRVGILNEELIEVSADASVGRRLSEGGTGGLADLTKTINRLFDAIGERDEEIHDPVRQSGMGSHARCMLVLV